MYGGDPYGGDHGASQFAGGGFMPTTPGPAFGPGGGGSSFSPSAGGGKKSGDDVLFPVTVRQMATSLADDPTDATLRINGHDVRTVTFVGRVASVEPRNTDVGFQIDDGSGKVEVRRWLDPDQPHEQKQLETVKVGSYVRVHGNVRVFGNKQSIVAHSLRLLSDHNEVTMHFLDCIFAWYNTRAGAQAAAGEMGAATGAHQSNPYGQYGPSSSVPPPLVSHNATGSTNQRVLAFFEEPQNLGRQEGVHLGAALQALRPAGVNEKQLREAIDFLVHEGSLYSTIDENHYRSTNG